MKGPQEKITTGRSTKTLDLLFTGLSNHCADLGREGLRK